MSEYRCLVLSAEGGTSWRRIEAATEKGALAALAADGLTALEIRSGAATLWERLNRPVGQGRALGLADQALVLTQLGMLVRSGLPVDRSLDLLREQAPRRAQRELLGEVLARVRAGGGLAASLEERRAFPPYAVGVIRSAEQAGRLGSALGSVAERMTLAAATRRQLVTALTYPAAVLVASLLALGLVLMLVVPQFEPLFAGHEAQLPLLTRAVLALSRLAVADGLLIAAALAGAGAVALLLARTEAARAALGRWSGSVPGFALREQYLAGQLCGVLGTLIENGVPVLRALQLARGTVGSARWRALLGGAEQRVREGMSLSRALGETGLLPGTAIRLIEVGERTGRLAETCSQASAVIAATARARIDRLVALANPVAIVLLGGLVAMLVAGVMLGIFAMGDFAG